MPISIQTVPQRLKPQFYGRIGTTEVVPYPKSIGMTEWCPTQNPSARVKSRPSKQSIGGHGGWLGDARFADFRRSRKRFQPFTDFGERGASG